MVGRNALYIVTKDEYQSTEEDENFLAPDNWWETATLKPDNDNVSKSLSVDETLLWRCINGKADRNGPNQLLISGGGGSGKSNLLSRFREHFPEFHKLIATAPTGVAALNIDGETIHRALGLGIADETGPYYFKEMSKNRFRYKKTWKFLLETRVLIIDEVSMIPPPLFEMLDYLFRSARGNSLPFGGVILVMFGDFLQLPPVNKSKNEFQVKYIFQTEVWKDMNKMRIWLNRNYRQSDKDFIKALEEVRFGKLSPESEKLLRTRLVNKYKPVEIKNVDVDQIEPIVIFAVKRTVDERNSMKLTSVLKSKNLKLNVFQPNLNAIAREGRKPSPKDLEMGRIALKNPKTLEDRFPVNVVEVCEGAQVMMRCNFYHALGVVNGTMGIVKNIGPDYISILFYVKSNFLENTIDVARHCFRTKFSDDVELALTQFPITLAWATTIHKVQCLTLDSLSVSPQDCFEMGQFYVAVSRVRSLEDLTLLNFNRLNIKTDQAAVKFESILESLEEEEEGEGDVEEEEEEDEGIEKKSRLL